MRFERAPLRRKGFFMFVNRHHLPIVVGFFHTMIFLRYLWMTAINPKVFFGPSSFLYGDLRAGLELHSLETRLIP
jgi:hypothetical protein